MEKIKNNEFRLALCAHGSQVCAYMLETAVAQTPVGANAHNFDLSVERLQDSCLFRFHGKQFIG